MEAIYARLSLDKAGSGLAIERQVAELREHFGLGADVPVYPDNDISATSGAPRPAYRRLIGEMEAGRVRKVYVWHTDRLWRVPRELEDFIDAAEAHGVTTLAKQAGLADLSTPGGRMSARIGVVMAKAEVELKAERQKSANLQKAQAGRPYITGRRPFGFARDGIHHVDNEAEAIRKAARDVLSGVSLRSIGKRWNEAGMTTTAGNEWRSAQVRSVLMNPRIAGIRRYRPRSRGKDPKQVEEFPASWEPIIPEDLYRAVAALLSDPARRTTPDTGVRKFMLSGIARCGKCLARVDSSRSSSGARLYKCNAKRHLALAAEPIDQAFLKSLRFHVAALRRAERSGESATVSRLLAQSDNSQNAEALPERAAILRARINEVTAWISDPGGAPISVIRGELGKLETELAKVTADMETSHAGSILTEIFRDAHLGSAIAKLGLDELRTLIGELTQSIVLYSPGQGKRVKDHMGDVLDFTWRHDLPEHFADEVVFA